MEKSTYVVTRFDVGHDGYYVEVSPATVGGEEMWEFFICKEDYDIKDFMYGIEKECAPESEWEHMILGDIDMYIDGLSNDEQAVIQQYKMNKGD